MVSMQATLVAHCGTTKVSRDELRMIPAPDATSTFKPIPHHEVVDALVEALGFRYIGVVRDEYAVSPDGMKMFGVLDLETAFDGCRFAIGIRNANDRSMRLGLTVGIRVLVCSNLAFQGEFTPVLAKHSKNFSIIDSLAVGVDRIQRNFDPLRQQVEAWRSRQITDDEAKLVIYRAFIAGDLNIPRALARDVHRNYFEPPHPDIAPRTMWSLSNAFTSALKSLDPIPFFQATAKLGAFFNSSDKVIEPIQLLVA